MTDRTAASTQDDLARRLTTLETSLARERSRRRRIERILVGGVLIAASLGAIAASGISNVIDVVQTRRLEILDENDRVVMLASAARHGGRLDIWDAAQRNIARLTGNGLGGDFVLFDRGGRQVAGMYAAGTSARIEVNNPENGSPAVLLASNDRGGVISAGDAQGRRGARMAVENGRGIVAVGTLERDLAVLHMTDSGGRIAARPLKGQQETRLEGEGVLVMSPSQRLASLGYTEDGGRLELLDENGKPRFSAVADTDGGRLETLDGNGMARVGLGVGTGGTGVRVRNSEGQAILAFGEDSQGGGAMEISDEEGNRCLSMGIGEFAGRLVISTREGNPSLNAGGGLEGGRIDVRDREGEVVATMRGLGDGGRVGVGSDPAGVGMYLDAKKNEPPTFAMFSPAGRIVAIAATASGGLINLHDAGGDVAVAIGSANEVQGGILSIRNDDGKEVVRAAVKEGGEGILEVYNESHTRKRSVAAP